MNLLRNSEILLKMNLPSGRLGFFSLSFKHLEGRYVIGQGTSLGQRDSHDSGPSYPDVSSCKMQFSHVMPHSWMIFEVEETVMSLQAWQLLHVMQHSGVK